MKTMLFATTLAFGLATFALPVSTGQAAPASPPGIEQPGPGAEPAQMSRRRMMNRRMTRRGMMRSRTMRGRMMRRGGMDRRFAPSQAGNARDPNRPVRAQSQGGTSGGPRF